MLPIDSLQFYRELANSLKAFLDLSDQDVQPIVGDLILCLEGQLLAIHDAVAAGEQAVIDKKLEEIALMAQRLHGRTITAFQKGCATLTDDSPKRSLQLEELLELVAIAKRHHFT
jgi:hypothetical protein